MPMHRFALSAALPLLFGAPAGQAPRLVDHHLAPVAGAVRLPGDISDTVLAPDGRRFADLAGGRIEIRSRRTGRRLASLRSGGGSLAWPARDRLVTLAGNAVQIHDLRTHHTQTRHLDGTGAALVAAGNHADVTFVRGGRFAVARFDGGRFRGITTLASGPGTTFLAVRGGYAVLSPTTGSARPDLIRLSDGRRTTLRVPNRDYVWIGRDLIASEGLVAKLDLGSGKVRATTEVALDQTLTPYRGGLIVGLGRDRFSAALKRVGGDPGAMPTNLPVFIDGDRLYGRTTDCPQDSGANVQIISAQTGKVLGHRGAGFTVGELGQGVSRPSAGDCD